MTLLYGPDSSKVISDHLKLPYTKPQYLLPKLLENLQLCPKINLSKREQGDERHSLEIRRWFSSLSQSERELALSFHNPVLVSLLIQMHLERLKSGEIEVALIEKPKSEEKIELSNYFYVRNKSTPSPSYEDVLRLTDSEEYLDTLTIDSSYIADPNKFFELMGCISQNQAFSAPCREYKISHKRIVYEYPSWICPYPNTFNTLLEWACAALEQSLWISYWNRHRNVQKSLGYAQLLPSVQTYWDNLSVDKKRAFFDNINTREIQAKLQRFATYRIPNLNFNTTLFAQIAAASRNLNSLRKKVIMNQSDNCVEALMRKVKDTSFVYNLVNSRFAVAYSLADFVARTVFFNIVKAKEEEELEKLLNEVHIEPSQPTKKKKKKRKAIAKVEIKKEVVQLVASPEPEKPNIQFESTDSEDFQLVLKKKRDKKAMIPLCTVVSNLTPVKPSKKTQKLFKTQSSELESNPSNKQSVGLKSNIGLNTKSEINPTDPHSGYNTRAINSKPSVDSKLKMKLILDSDSKAISSFVVSPDSKTFSNSVFSPDSKTNSSSVFSPELKTNSSSVFSPELKTNSDSIFSPELKANSSSIFSPELKTNSSSVFSPELKINSDSIFSPELKANSDSIFSPELKTNPDSIFSPELKTNSNPIFSPELKTNSDSIFSPELKTNSNPIFSPELKTNSDSVFSPELKTNPDSIFSSDTRKTVKLTSNSNLKSSLDLISTSDKKSSSKTNLNSNIEEYSETNPNQDSLKDSEMNLISSTGSNSDLHSEPTPFSSLHSEILEFYNEVSMKSKRKLEVIHKLVRSLSVLINSVYPNTEIRIFGSYASNLALDTSDVDLQVLNLYLNNRALVQQVCIQLGTLLRGYSCVLAVNIIPQATVPVIKLEVDLHRFDVLQQGKINVDLSFGDTSESHGGFKSLRASMDYLSAYPSLASITIVLKAMLINKNLNNAYLGGINSYSLLLWVVAFYKHCKRNFEDYGELLLAVLEFYGHTFDFKTLAIDPQNNDGFSPKAASDYATTIDPVSNTNDTTRTGFRIQCVLSEFAQAYKTVLEGGLKKLF